MPRIDWSSPAVADLDRINHWLTEHRTPEVALRTVRAIRRRAGWLSNFPHGGRPTTEGFRMVRVYGTRYLIVYRIAADVVDVLRVHHEREDWLIEP